MKFVILHGTDGNSKLHWFPWLKQQLEVQGHEVWVPDLPGAAAPNAAVWTDFLLDSGYDFEGSVLIGHSAGSVEILALLQSLPGSTNTAASILVGTFQGDLGWPELKGMNVKFDYEKIKQHCSQFLVVHSDNDPHCPLEGAQEVCQKLDGEFVLMEDMGHFSTNQDSRFKEYPELLSLIEKNIASED